MTDYVFRRLRERIALWIAPWLDGGIKFGTFGKPVDLYRSSYATHDVLALDKDGRLGVSTVPATGGMVTRIVPNRSGTLDEPHA